MLIAKKPAKQGLSIIIVGCGKVGLTLIEQLVKEGHDITIIDQNAKKVQEVANTYDVMGITGNGASHRVQMDAGIASANLLIAVTESDELNLLCCTVANQVANCSTIARVRTPDYSGEAAYLRDKLGLAGQQTDAGTVEVAGTGQLHGEVQAHLAAQVGQHGVGLLDVEDALHDLKGHRLDVNMVGHVGVGHDGSGVGVEQNGLDTLCFQGAARLGTGVVEFSSLTDDDGAGADDQHFFDSGVLRHFSVPPSLLL